MRDWIDKEDKLVRLAEEYKSWQSMKSVSFDEVIDVDEKGPEVVTVKIDGELALYDSKRNVFASRGGRLRSELPVCNEIKEILKKKDISHVILAGELHVLGEDGLPVSYDKAISILRAPKSVSDEQRIAFAVFDILEYQKKKLHPILGGSTPYKERIALVESIFKNGELIYPVFWKEDGRDVIKELWQENVLGEDYEGLVIHYDDIVKVKPEFTADVAVVAIEKGKHWDDRKQAGALWVAFINEDKHFLIAGKVGTGFSEEDRRYWYKVAKENKVEESKNKIWIKPKYVIEVQYRRYQVKDTDSYQWNGSKWRKLSPEEGVVLQQSSMIRIREDKKPTPKDCRLEQIPNLRIASKILELVEMLLGEK